MQPQEIEVWYVLPAIRKALALILINKFKLSQKKAAELLDLRESTVSQYVKGRRVKESILDKHIEKEIERSAQRIFESKKELINEVQRLCSLIRGEKILCRLHKKREKIIGTCEACLK